MEDGGDSGGRKRLSVDGGSGRVRLERQGHAIRVDGERTDTVSGGFGA